MILSPATQTHQKSGSDETASGESSQRQSQVKHSDLPEKNSHRRWHQVGRRKASAGGLLAGASSAVLPAVTVTRSGNTGQCTATEAINKTRGGQPWGADSRSQTDCSRPKWNTGTDMVCWMHRMDDRWAHGIQLSVATNLFTKGKRKWNKKVTCNRLQRERVPSSVLYTVNNCGTNTFCCGNITRWLYLLPHASAGLLLWICAIFILRHFLSLVHFHFPSSACLGHKFFFSDNQIVLESVKVNPNSGKMYVNTSHNVWELWKNCSSVTQ